MQKTEEILDLALCGKTDVIWNILKGDITPVRVSNTPYEFIDNGQVAAFKGPNGIILDIGGTSFGALDFQAGKTPLTTLGARTTYQRLTAYFDHDKAA
ncbi:MAG TPA: hypothetical protein VHP58_03310 [Alphaproteobacteria bacterium]|nr:hypothetical protein [Alphaproteobacteria bacterium]